MTKPADYFAPLDDEYDRNMEAADVTPRLGPVAFVRAFIPADNPARIAFEAASARIHGGPGVYPDPFCPDCRIVRFPLQITARDAHGWPLGTLQREQSIKCAKHFRRE